MTTKIFALACTLILWHLGLMSVMSWHTQQEHQDAKILYLKPIDNTIRFVHIAN